MGAYCGTEMACLAVVLTRKEALYAVLALLGVVVLWRLSDVASSWLCRLWATLTPVRTVRARVADKRTAHLDLGLGVGQRADPRPVPQGSFVSFSFGGCTVEMVAADEVYRKASIGCEGILTYRGSTAIDFIPLM